MNISIDVRQQQMIVARATAVIVGVLTVVWLETFTFRLNNKILLLIYISDSFVVFYLFILLGS